MRRRLPLLQRCSPVSELTVNPERGIGNMYKLHADDFNMSELNENGQFVRISELNDMIERGVIEVDHQKLQEYKFDTRVMYDRSQHAREEIMKIWCANC